MQLKTVYLSLFFIVVHMLKNLVVLIGLRVWFVDVFLPPTPSIVYYKPF
jgi:hypothetical protein